MIDRLMKRFALSREGAKGLVRATAAWIDFGVPPVLG